ncbi:MAG: hypothetical protein ACU0D1_19555 [Pseudooceanicola nanhaiensis]
MEKRFVLHIGANKTGTSSIQRMLFENRAVLAEMGWTYSDFEVLHMAHHPIAYSISENPKFSLKGDWEERFRKLIADRDRKFVFSSELFFRSVPPAKVARFFPPEETRVVLYLRDHLSYMMSWYAQAVQARNVTASFGDYVQIFSEPFMTFLDAWEEYYSDFEVRPFVRDTLAGRDARIDFLQYLDGVDVEKLTLQDTDSNLSISGNLLFFKKILNNYMSADEAFYPPVTDEIGAFAGLRPGFSGRFRLEKTEVNLVRRVFRDDRRALKEKGIVFPPMPEVVEGHLSPDYDTLREDVRAIKEVAVRTDKSFLKYAARWQDWHTL